MPSTTPTLFTAEADELSTDSIRPIEPIGLSPKSTAVRNFADALVSKFGHTEDGAEAIARAVEDPSEARRQLGHLSSTRVRGGTLLTLDVRVNALSVIVYPTNMRVTGSTVYPAAVASAEGEAAKFWSPSDLRVHPDSNVEVVLEAGTRKKMQSVLDTARTILLAQNDWTDSIVVSGVFSPVTLMPITVTTLDEIAPPATALASPDGSSRIVSCHKILGIRPADPLYGPMTDPRQLRRMMSEVASIFGMPAEKVTDEARAKARALMVPARVIVGFEPDSHNPATLIDAVEEYVAFIHIEPPRPWEDIAITNAKGDDVLRALVEAHEITDAEAVYLGGMLTFADAAAGGLPAYPDVRVARIVELMAGSPRTSRGRAVSRGVLRHSQKQKAMQSEKSEVAAGLALRSFASANPALRRSAEAVLPRALQAKQIWNSDWTATGDDPDLLWDRAVRELAHDGGPGPAAVELAVRGGYVLAIEGALRRESSGEMRHDNRSASTILSQLMSNPWGIHVLFRAVQDHRDGVVPRQVDEAGLLIQNVNGDNLPMTNPWIRTTFPEGMTQPDPNPDPTPLPPTPIELFYTKVRSIERQVDALTQLMTDLRNIVDDTGVALADSIGIDNALATRLAGDVNAIGTRIVQTGYVWTLRHPRPALDGQQASEDDQ